MIQENISAFKGPHLLLNLMVSVLKAENVAASLKLRNANVQKAYCEKNSSVKKLLLFMLFLQCVLFSQSFQNSSLNMEAQLEYWITLQNGSEWCAHSANWVGRHSLPDGYGFLWMHNGPLRSLREKYETFYKQHSKAGLPKASAHK